MLTEHIIRFCRLLRQNGFGIGVQESMEALSAIQVITLSDRQVLKFSLRALLCSSHTEYELFEELFEQFWKPADSFCEQKPKPAALKHAVEGNFIRFASEVSEQADMESKETTGASSQERLRKTDFSLISDTDLPLLEEIALRLWKQMSRRLIRRWKLYGRGGPLDLRHTIRQSISQGGDPLKLLFKEKRTRKLHLVTLLDVSGSMERYSAFLLRFLFALHKYFRRADSFLFSTRLTYISNALRKHDLSQVMNLISLNVEDWSGGTRIGECLREFNRTYSRKVLTRNSLMIILSDGWDTGNPEELAEQLRSIKRKVKKLIWLNPLLGFADYQPLTRGMAAALPFADVFAPAHNVQSLLDLEKHLNTRYVS